MSYPPRFGNATLPPPFASSSTSRPFVPDPSTPGTSSSPTMTPSVTHPSFDIFEWHPIYISCQKYFLDHAQHDPTVQAVAALLNICLPFQWAINPLVNASGPSPMHMPSGPLTGAYSLPFPRNAPQGPVGSGARGGINWVSLVPYIRRLVVTGFDRAGVLHGFFGDDWRKGVGPLQECERRNYLFAAKSVGWAKVKALYDMGPHESVPFLQPLKDAQLVEIESAEKTWSQWLAMQDWMVGPRAPDAMDDNAEAAPLWENEG